MRTSFTLTALVLLKTVSSSPFPDHNSGVALEDRGRQPCKWKQDICCKPIDKNKQYKDERSNYGKCRTIRVKSGDCIQHAIKSAHRGDQIIVEAGTYEEQLTIDKDGIELNGQNAVLVPPGQAVQNPCSGLTGPDSQTGICVTGSNLKLADFKTEHRKVLSVGSPVKDVIVRGFEVHGFSGINIAVLGARNTQVLNNKLTNGQAYGALTLGSVNTFVSENVVSSTKQTFIGICMDNFADVYVWKNQISKQTIGLCVQTTNANIQYNQVTDCCFGAFIDPGIQGAKLRYNHFGPAPKTGCEAVAAGIFLDGAIKTEVTDNVIEGIKNGGTASGVIVVDDPCNQTGPELSLSCLVLGHAAIASDNVVIRNTLRNNDLDIYSNSTGKGNVAQCNDCKASFPENLCAA